jgi:hypothetical protein
MSQGRSSQATPLQQSGLCDGGGAGGDAAFGFEDDGFAADELVVVEAEAAAFAVFFVDRVGDAFVGPLAAVDLDDAVEVDGFAVGAGDEVAVGADAFAVLEEHPADEGKTEGHEDAADDALAGEVAGAAVLGEFFGEVVGDGVGFPGADDVGVFIGGFFVGGECAGGERDELLVALFLGGPGDVAVVAEPEAGAVEHERHHDHAAAPFLGDAGVDVHGGEGSGVCRKGKRSGQR